MRKKTAFRIYSEDVRAPKKSWCLGDIPPFVFQNQSDKIVAIPFSEGDPVHLEKICYLVGG